MHCPLTRRSSTWCPCLSDSFTLHLSYFSCFVIKHPDKGSSRKEGFVLAHSSRVQSDHHGREVTAAGAGGSCIQSVTCVLSSCSFCSIPGSGATHRGWIMIIPHGMPRDPSPGDSESHQSNNFNQHHSPITVLGLTERSLSYADNSVE